MSNAISTYLKRIVLVTTSFVLALGLTTAAVPFLAAQTASAVGVSFYVATTGDDSSATGAADAPFATINKAIQSASAGDVISVAPGEYIGDVIIDEDVTLTSPVLAGAIIRGQVTINAAGSGATVEQFKIQTTGKEYSVAVSNTNSTPDNRTTIYRNTIDLTYSATQSAKAIYVGDGTSRSNIYIGGNTIKNVTSDSKGAYGILVSTGTTSGLSIAGNNISNLSGAWTTGVGLEGNTPLAGVTNITVSNLNPTTYYPAEAISFQNNPSANSVRYFTGNKLNGKTIIKDVSNIEVSTAWSGKTVTNSTYPQVESHDGVYRYYGLNAFSMIQDGLDAVSKNGTVKVANGSYGGAAKIKKDGTKLVGQSKNNTKLYVKSNSEGGVYSTGLDDITIKELTVLVPTTGTAPTSLIKLVNGNKALIHHVDVKASQSVSTTGVDINSFSNATLHNVNVQNVGKDGVSVVSNYGNASHTSNNVTLKDVDVTGATWSGIAFYTNAGGATTSMQGITMRDVMVNGADRGIYFEGFNGATITGLNGSPVNVGNADLKNSLKEFINNEQSADVIATSATFNGQLGNAMSTAEQNTLDNKIKDKKDDSSFGRVVFDGTAPSQPSGLTIIKGHNSNPANDLECSAYINDTKIRITWNANPESDVVYYWFGTKSNAHHKKVYATHYDGNITPGNSPYFYTVIAVDAAGNESLIAQTCDFTLDQEAPVVEAVTLNNETLTDNYLRDINCEAKDKSLLVRGKIDLGATISDDVSGVNSASYKIRKVSAGGCTMTSVYQSNVAKMQHEDNDDWTTLQATQLDTSADSSLVDGDYTIMITVKDVAGNVTTKYVDITVDNTAPAVTIVAPTAIESGAPLTLNGEVNGPVKTVQVTLNGDTHDAFVNGNNWSLTIADTNDLVAGQTYEITVTATDEAGNSTSTTSDLTVNDIANRNPIDENDTPDVIDNDGPQAGALNSGAQNPTPVGNAATDDLGEEDVQGAQTDKNENQLKNPAVLAGATGDGWNILGLMWYWWLLIIAAVGAAWWMIAAARRRGNES